MADEKKEPKITDLTEEQKARLPEFVDKWIAIGLDTTPADRPSAEQAVKDLYKMLGRDEPKILWAESPQAGHDLHCKLREKKDWVIPFYGQHDAGWLSFYDVFHEFGVDVEEIEPLIRLAQACGWVWMFEYAAICTERPKEIHKNERSHLHNASGPAIAYPDGWQLFALNNVIVPEKVVMDPMSYTKEEILEIRNTEITRALAEQMGWDKYLDRLGVNVIDSYVDPKTDLKYELLESQHRVGDNEPRFLRKQSSELKDGTQPWYIEPVHPDLKTAQAARKFQAMAAFVDDDENEYEQIMQHCNDHPDLEYTWER